jgi:hypothetical protein
LFDLNTNIDISTLGTIAGVVVALACAVAQLYKRQKPELGIVIVFFSTYSFVLGLHLIYVSILGELEDLPANWRPYLAAAGIMGSVISAYYIKKFLSKIFWKNEKDDKE